MTNNQQAGFLILITGVLVGCAVAFPQETKAVLDALDKTDKPKDPNTITMRKKEKWMFKGALVLALGKKGTITKMQENTLNGTDYVYQIHVRLEGEKHANPYHPSDLEELIPQKAKS